MKLLVNLLKKIFSARSITVWRGQDILFCNFTCILCSWRARVVLNLWLQMMTMQIVLVAVAHKCTRDQCVVYVLRLLTFLCDLQTRMHCKTSITYRIATKSVILITWKLIFFVITMHIQRAMEMILHATWSIFIFII